MLSTSHKSQNPKISSSSSSSSSSILEDSSLPTDLWIEILKRLPLKSLVRSTCVCKSWYGLLKSPTFVSTHATFNFKISKIAQNLLLFKDATNIHDAKGPTNFPVYNYYNITMIDKPGFNCIFSKNHFVVSSADGVVCLFEFYCQNPEKAPLILWNPSIRKIHVPLFPVHVDGGLEFTPGGFPKLIFGFGFDSCSNGYKAVRVAYYNVRGGDPKGTFFRVHVYCVNDCEWKDLGRILVPQYITTIRWRGVCLNGVIHWICNMSVNLGTNCPIQRSILTLDLKSGEFGEIKLPNELVDVAYHTLRVVMVPRGGKQVLGVIKKACDVISLWVMEEYGVKDSWVELFSVNFYSDIKNDLNVVVLSDHSVVVQLTSATWVSYDHATQQYDHIWAGVSKHLEYVDAYVESLILLGLPIGADISVLSNAVQQVDLKPRRGRRRKARAM